MAKFSKVAATFGKSKRNYQKQTTSCPDSRHLLLQTQICNYAFSSIKGITNHSSKAELVREENKSENSL